MFNKIEKFAAEFKKENLVFFGFSLPIDNFQMMLKKKTKHLEIEKLLRNT